MPFWTISPENLRDLNEPSAVDELKNPGPCVG
jgi:hypothetical protein